MRQSHQIILGVMIIAAALAAVFFSKGCVERQERQDATAVWQHLAIAVVDQVYHAQIRGTGIHGCLVPPTPTRPGQDVAWTTPEFMRFANGEWLAYWHSNHHTMPLVGDHFIARASTGQWYYSSFHFCRDLIGLYMVYGEQPQTLAEFAWKCGLAPFDGKSDVCLQRTTWPDINDVWSGKAIPPWSTTAVPASTAPAPLPPESAHAAP